MVHHSAKKRQTNGMKQQKWMRKNKMHVANKFAGFKAWCIGRIMCGNRSLFQECKIKTYFDISFIKHALCEIKTSKKKFHLKYSASRDANPWHSFLQTKFHIILDRKWAFQMALGYHDILEKSCFHFRLKYSFGINNDGWSPTTNALSPDSFRFNAGL